MRRSLQRLQTAAADRWAFVPHPRLYRRPGRRRDWVDSALKGMLFVWLMWWIWAPVLAVTGFLALAWLGGRS